MSSSIIKEQELRNFTESVFKKMGCPVADAKLAADVLIASDLLVALTGRGCGGTKR
jgi:LDH2 family malate/lactate/ureidoglycolate dehydrogenase